METTEDIKIVDDIVGYELCPSNKKTVMKLRPSKNQSIEQNKITSKRFLDSIYGFTWFGFSIQNYWDNGENGHNAVFLNYSNDSNGFQKGGEYIKIYCDANLYNYPNLKIKIYLLNRAYNGKRDFLLKEFDDWGKYKNYIETGLLDSIKKLNNSQKECYD